MNPHAYAVRCMRQLGRELVAGSWARRAVPMSVPQVVLVMTEALATVVRIGVSNVVDEFDARVSELLDDLAP